MTVRGRSALDGGGFEVTGADLGEDDAFQLGGDGRR